MVADIISLVVLALSFVRGASKGFVKSISRLLVFVLAIILLYLSFTPVFHALQDVKPYIQLETTISSNIKTYITDHVSDQHNTTTKAIDSLKFPKPITTFLNGYCNDMNDVIVEDVSVTVTSALTALSMRIIVGLALFIALLIVLCLLLHVLDVLAHLPVIHGANKLLGGAIGLINGLLILYTICFVIMALPIGSTVWLQQYMDGSYFKSFVYDNNVFSYLVKFISF